MNRLFLYFLLAAVSFLGACNSTDSDAGTQPIDVGSDSANFTSVQWMDSLINFGTVTKGEKVHIVYKCKNTGTKPLFIYYVRPGCGCTVADYTKAAIPPGGMGEVNAEFDSNHGTAGEIRKTITVQTNTTNPSPHLVFTGTVNAPPETKGQDSIK
ncbi:MAG TPA: DUF1573 domain-containing protein [Panacibacter sp.]|nr:DUF1573 domain-containing protein [Panacibacter sp.]